MGTSSNCRLRLLLPERLATLCPIRRRLATWEILAAAAAPPAASIVPWRRRRRINRDVNADGVDGLVKVAAEVIHGLGANVPTWAPLPELHAPRPSRHPIRPLSARKEGQSSSSSVVVFLSFVAFQWTRLRLKWWLEMLIHFLGCCSWLGKEQKQPKIASKVDFLSTSSWFAM